MSIHLPQNISVASAKLPQTYEAAKQALASCADIDECVDWADKAQALASYAKQADDDALQKLAVRIQARAVRRCGELLKQFDARPKNAEKQSVGAHTLFSRREIADQAGMSKHQQTTAVRVASIPEPEFEAAVESDEKVTVTQLAERGKKTRLVGEVDKDPDQFAAATFTVGAMRRFAEKCQAHTAAYIAGGVMEHEVEAARQLVSSIDAWLDQFVVNLKG